MSERTTLTVRSKDILHMRVTVLSGYPLDSPMPNSSVPVRDNVAGRVIGAATIFRDTVHPTTLIADVELTELPRFPMFVDWDNG